MFPAGKSELSVRVNSIDSGLCKIDLDTVLKGPIFPSTLHLPKMESKFQLDWLAQELDLLLGKKHNIKLIVFVESAKSLLDMKELIQHCFTLMHQGAPFTLEAVIFGSDDFCADIGKGIGKITGKIICKFFLGATRTPEAKELLYSRQYFVTCAKAYRLQAIDLVYINFKVKHAKNLLFKSSSFLHYLFHYRMLKAYSVNQWRVLKWASQGNR